MGKRVKEESLAKLWEDVHYFLQRDIARHWFSKKQIQKPIEDAKEIEAQLRSDVKYLGQGKKNKRKNIACCRRIAKLLGHIEYNRKWQADLYQTVTSLIKMIKGQKGWFDRVEAIIVNVLAHYEIGKLKNFEFIAEGIANINLSIQTTSGKYFFRASQEDQVEKEVEAEHKLLEHLTKKGFIAVGPMKTKEGDTFIVEEKRVCAIFPWSEGIHVRWTLNNMKKVAKVLAEYHLVVADFHPNESQRESDIRAEPKKRGDKIESIKTRNFEGSAATLTAIAALSPRSSLDEEILGQKEKFLQIYEELCKVVIPIRFRKEEFLMAHKDLDRDNLLFKDDEIVAVLDFDRVPFEPKIGAIAETILLYCIKKDKLHLGHVEKFLQAYWSVDTEYEFSPQILWAYFLWRIFIRLGRAIRDYKDQREARQSGEHTIGEVRRVARLLERVYINKSTVMQACSK